MIDLLYADDVMVVVSKPDNLLSVPGIGEAKRDCLVTRLQLEFPTIRIVHRLDYATSGLLVLALNAGSHRALSIQFQERVPKKRYQALVTGNLAETQGKIDLPLSPDWENRPLSKVDLENGKPSLTHWQCIERQSEHSRVLLYPHTGRSHQLRVHLLAIGHPILGDVFYTDEAEHQQHPRMMLHADQLELRHPLSGEWMVFESPCPF
ncbi:MAG: RluA family pseudouridine synthase [Nitrincola lacisaponensis]|uniref:Dual-specificity RNA pseudouridine synthase RluA n=1 Tax=Nitrincola lacisaponensis TaxID=267850 RepID=A0A063Y0W6_9GAMM|nr:RluA family pseudouridine synthase [Nitrincola lacisaponensis]KDE38406.1 Ribosomal large subunit pseudouridine synthase A [Nitrincola lacisaponensis]